MLTFLFSCKTSKLPFSSIEFGSGGGFTGREKTYTLTEEGKIQLTESTQGTKKNAEVRSLSGKEKKEISSAIKEFESKNIIYNQPGNIYNFIEIKVDSDTYRYAWSPSDKNIPVELVDLYRVLMHAATTSK